MYNVYVRSGHSDYLCHRAVNGNSLHSYMVSTAEKHIGNNWFWNGTEILSDNDIWTSVYSVRIA